MSKTSWKQESASDASSVPGDSISAISKRCESFESICRLFGWLSVIGAVISTVVFPLAIFAAIPGIVFLFAGAALFRAQITLLASANETRRQLTRIETGLRVE